MQTILLVDTVSRHVLPRLEQLPPEAVFLWVYIEHLQTQQKTMQFSVQRICAHDMADTRYMYLQHGGPSQERCPDPSSRSTSGNA